MIVDEKEGTLENGKVVKKMTRLDIAYVKISLNLYCPHVEDRVVFI